MWLASELVEFLVTRFVLDKLHLVSLLGSKFCSAGDFGIGNLITISGELIPTL